jgi:hypothetical protein
MKSPNEASAIESAASEPSLAMALMPPSRICQCVLLVDAPEVSAVELLKKVTLPNSNAPSWANLPSQS